MTEFFDTSVLVAAFWGGHPQHDSSLALVSEAHPGKSSCGLHTLAEVYSVMTSLPVKNAVPPDQAILFVQEVRQRMTVMAIGEADYYETLLSASERGFAGGRIYDALLLRCAAKSGAEVIYTWNLKHFRAIAPEMADRIRTP